MQTYLFDDLDERGQEYAISYYWADSEVQKFTEEAIARNPEDIPTASDCFRAQGWLFTEHGERIA